SRRRLRGTAPLADDVDVLVRSLPELRVVVVEVEGVGLGLLEEIDDVAVLVRALGQPVVGALLRERGHRGRANDGADEDRRRLHGRSFLAVSFSGAASGPAFQNAIAMRPSDSERTCDGTLQETSSYPAGRTTELRLIPRDRENKIVSPSRR